VERNFTDPISLENYTPVDIEIDGIKDSIKEISSDQFYRARDIKERETEDLGTSSAIHYYKEETIDKEYIEELTDIEDYEQVDLSYNAAPYLKNKIQTKTKKRESLRKKENKIENSDNKIVIKINMSVLSVGSSLEMVKISKDIIKFLASTEGSWISFGKKSSHILRTMLFRLFDKEKMDGDAKFMVYFFCSIIKNRERILSGMELLGDDVRSQKWYTQTKIFFEKRTVTYVRNETREKFATLHLPTTNPGLDILCYLMQMDKPQTRDDMCDQVFNLVTRQTFSQFMIDDDLQDFNRFYVRKYWEETVKLKDLESRQKSNSKEIGFVEEYYDTNAGDGYKFIGPDFVEVNFPTAKDNSLAPYDMEEVTELYVAFLKFKYEEWNEDEFKDQFVLTEDRTVGLKSEMKKPKK